MDVPSGILSPKSPKWDLVVLTARNVEQKELFELQLARLRLIQRGFCAEICVLEDRPANAKIGSGGATLNALVHLFIHFGGESFFVSKRVLLLHSGGLSQRIFHVALTGKAFMLMPDGLTLLEHKLFSYQPLLLALSHSHLPGFVFVASADVLEYFPPDFSVASPPANSGLLLIAHHSNLEIAEQHGVYLLDEGANANPTNEGQIRGTNHQLKRVLQKPNREEIRRVGAVLKNKNSEEEELALTDSCYLLGHELAIEMIRMCQNMGNAPLVEICCYRDFLGPLGNSPENDRKIHLRADEPALLKWQMAIWDLMHHRHAHVLDLGPNSFFHFGTPNELLHHFCGTNSVFRNKFLSENKKGNAPNSLIEKRQNISTKSLVEWSRLNGNCVVGEGCILSGLIYEGEDQLEIGDGVCASTFPIEGGQESDKQKGSPIPVKYVTVAFHRDDDLKQSSAHSLRWFGHSLRVPSDISGPTSLWDFPLFSAHPSPSESLLATLAKIANHKQKSEMKGRKNGDESGNGQGLWSIAQVLAKTNARTVLEGRERFIGEE